MPEQDPSALEERIHELEQTVEKLQYTIEKMQDRLASDGNPRVVMPEERKAAPPPRRVEKPALPVSSPSKPKRSRKAPAPADAPPAAEEPKKKLSARVRPLYRLNAEDWLNRIGIVLLFASIAYAFKYALDQSWFTPDRRVIFGSGVGLALLVIGLRLHAKRPRFSQVLMGGSIATFYITVYGAYQIFGLVNYAFAFASMLAITGLSFLLAVQRNDAILGIMATVGGLVTPFIMNQDGGSVLGLVSYTSLILTGASAIYWFRGWRSLLFISSVGAWLVLLLCYLTFFLEGQSVVADRVIMQAGIILMWLLFWGMPMIRGMLRAKTPDKWPAPPPVRAVGYFFNHPALPLSVSTPLIALIFSILIWDPSDKLWGLIILEAAAVYGFIYATIRGNKLNHLAQMQGLTATFFLTIALFYLFDGYTLLVALAAGAGMIRIVAKTLSDRLLSYASHILFLGLNLGILYRLLMIDVSGTPIFNLPALCELAVIIQGAAMSPLMKRAWMRTVYRVMSHVLFLGWLYRELSALGDGQSFITVAWGVYAVILLVYAFRTNHRNVRIMGLSTVGLVVIKLFQVDLAEVDALVRVVLFFGFGIVFMVLSYLKPTLLKFKEAPTDQPAKPPKKTEPSLK